MSFVAITLPAGTHTAEAKTPGKKYCFLRTCHRVLTLSEPRRRIGRAHAVPASFYRHCKRDRFNPCGLTSSGTVFRPGKADNGASPIYPNGTKLLVWNPRNKRAAVVRIDNAGPYWGRRTLDLSHAAARKLGFSSRGVARLIVKVIYAPTPSEARYRRRRVYAPVKGYIGRFANLAGATRVAMGTKPRVRYAAAKGQGSRRNPALKPVLPTPSPMTAARLRIVSASVPPLPAPRTDITVAALEPAPPAPAPATATGLHIASVSSPPPPVSRTVATIAALRLPAQLVRAELPRSWRRRLAERHKALRRRRLAVAAQRERQRKAKALEQARVQAARAEEAKARQALRAARKQRLAEERRSKRAQSARKTASSRSKDAQSSKTPVAQEDAQGRGRQATTARRLPARQVEPASSVTTRPKLVWRKKYFGVNGGSS